MTMDSPVIRAKGASLGVSKLTTEEDVVKTTEAEDGDGIGAAALHVVSTHFQRN